MKKISVVIPSYNSWKTLGATLSALASQTRKDSIAEVLVVDSSDDAKTRTFLKSLQVPNLRVIEAGTRVMPAIGRNLGAALSTGEVLVFIDSDAYMADDWIEKILERDFLRHRTRNGLAQLLNVL